MDIVISSTADGIVIDLRVIPRAQKTAIAGSRDGALLVRLKAPPVDGAANAALVEFIAGVLEVPRRAVTLVSGERSRQKRVRVAGVSVAEAMARLS